MKLVNVQKNTIFFWEIFIWVPGFLNPTRFTVTVDSHCIPGKEVIKYLLNHRLKFHFLKIALYTRGFHSNDFVTT